jgi:hypothetical protein
MLSFLAFLSIIGLFLGVLIEEKSKTLNELNGLKAKTNSLECALLIEALYSNTVELSNGKELDCFVDGNRVKSVVGEKKKSVELLSGKAKLVSFKGKVFIEVDYLKHYGENK